MKVIIFFIYYICLVLSLKKDYKKNKTKIPTFIFSEKKTKMYNF